ncbi:phosphatase 2C-like domain-containing protein [Tribonema minus]|uniref:Phosphatase 2C-like domain-containing protein n=1 Tax=Tribonema minus TaxID=303371 RepID=A0A835ZH02_9STRA|nr:phosphatase 2C-like domain-containing protein [Tribonema minus]
MNPGRRNTMEDAHTAVAALGGDANTSFFAVYDGHGGRGIVDFLETRLEENLALELAAKDDAGVCKRIERAFLTTDVESKQENLITSGATAVICLLRLERGGNGSTEGSLMLYAANVGDSRAVLYQRGAAARLTRDHKADDPAEVERVEASGGFVLRGRVLGILAVARSFGDHGMKEWVPALPFTSATSLAPPAAVENCVVARSGGGGGGGGSGGGDFFILACDGIWDVLSDEEACAIVARAAAEAGEGGGEGDARNAPAQALVAEALRRGSTDNITVMVVFL